MKRKAGTKNSGSSPGIEPAGQAVLSQEPGTREDAMFAKWLGDHSCFYPLFKRYALELWECQIEQGLTPRGSTWRIADRASWEYTLQGQLITYGAWVVMMLGRKLMDEDPACFAGFFSG